MQREPLPDAHRDGEHTPAPEHWPTEVALRDSPPPQHAMGPFLGWLSTSGAGNHATAMAARGRPLDSGIRTELEGQLGADLTRVRVHTDPAAAASAEALDATAYTIGSDIVFGAGAYRPTEPAGRALLGHELAHVVQQTRGGGTAGAGAEADADRAAAAVAAGGPATVASTAPVGVAKAGKGWYDQLKSKAVEKYDKAVEASKEVARDKLKSVIGGTEGVLLEAGNIVDTLAWVPYAKIDAVDAVVDKAAKAGGLSKGQTKAVRFAAHAVARDNAESLNVVRDYAKKAGATDEITGAPAVSGLLTKPGDWLEKKIDKSDTFKDVKPDDKLLTDREIAQISTAVAAQAGLAYVGVEEVQLGLKVVGTVGSVKSIVTAAQKATKENRSFLKDKDFWLAIGSAVLNIIGLKAASGGRKLLTLFIDAALIGLSTVPPVLKFADDLEHYHAPDRDQVLHQDLAAVTRAALETMRQVIQHASAASKARGAKGAAAAEPEGPVAARPPTGEAAPTPSDLPSAKPPAPAGEPPSVRSTASAEPDTHPSAPARRTEGPAPVDTDVPAGTPRAAPPKPVVEPPPQVVALPSRAAAPPKPVAAPPKPVTAPRERIEPAPKKIPSAPGSEAGNEPRPVRPDPTRGRPGPAEAEPAAPKPLKSDELGPAAMKATDEPDAATTAKPSAKQPELVDADADAPRATAATADGDAVPPPVAKPAADADAEAGGSGGQRGTKRPDEPAHPTEEPSTPRPAATAEPAPAAGTPARSSAAEPGPLLEPPAPAATTPATVATPPQKLGVVKSQQRVEGAIKKVDQAWDRMVKADQRVANHEQRLAEATAKGWKTKGIESDLAAARKAQSDAAVDVNTSAANLRKRNAQLVEAQERANERAAKAAVEEAPRMKPGDPFDPKLRRPDLDDFRNVPSADVARHDGSGGGDAGVSIYRLEFPERVGAIKGGTPQEQGHSYEGQGAAETGGKFRETHTSGDRERHGDLGSHEMKHGRDLSSSDLDQLWRDLHDYDQKRAQGRPAPHLITPHLSEHSEKQLRKLVGIFRHLSGRDVRIVVRETDPPPPPTTATPAPTVDQP